MGAGTVTRGRAVTGGHGKKRERVRERRRERERKDRDGYSMRPMLLGKRVGIITGAARGIGRACAEAFLREGASVVIADIDLEAAEAAARAIDPGGKRVIAVRVDVTRRADHDRAVEEAVRAFGRLDILVNNAGIAGRPGTLETQSEEDIDRILAVNVKGV